MNGRNKVLVTSSRKISVSNWLYLIASCLAVTTIPYLHVPMLYPHVNLFHAIFKIIVHIFQQQCQRYILLGIKSVIYFLSRSREATRGIACGLLYIYMDEYDSMSDLLFILPPIKFEVDGCHGY